MMTSIKVASVAAIFAGVLLSTPASASLESRQSEAFDVNDLSYLWPPPATDEDVKNLITAEDAGADGRRIWPADVFKLLLDTAQKITPATTVGTTQINFEAFKAQFEMPSTWKVVSFRVDPSAPGGHADAVKQFGSTPQLRVVFQPVTKINSSIRVHDVTAHLAFSYVNPPAPGAPPFPATADKALFTQIVSDLKALRATSAAGGAPTRGALSIHPGLRAKAAGLSDAVKRFLLQRCAQGQLNELAFMGIQPPEPWIFFSMRKNAAGSYDLVTPKVIGTTAEVLSIRDPAKVMPAPKTMNVPGKGGVSTASLFLKSDAELAAPAIAGHARPTHADIPDIIANPSMSNVLNTDCVSCHSESTRRTLRKLNGGDGMFRFVQPAGISGVDPAMVPAALWNVRNFGWFQPRNETTPIQPTISQRTANETAEATDFTNREYLPGTASPAAPAPLASHRINGNGNGHSNGNGNGSPQEHTMVSPLTLVMDVKDGKFAELKKMLEDLQSLPPDKNPVVVALDKLKTVHYARFVLLNNRQLAVITTYDGSFDDYIDAFVNTIGDIFDKILAHVADWPSNMSVKAPENRQRFLDYVKAHDLRSVGPFYSAYPDLGVLDILALQKKAGAVAK